MKTAITSDFADLRDISHFHWHYAGTPNESQTALEISVPGKRISIQLDSQIQRITEQHAELLAALERAASYLEGSDSGVESMMAQDFRDLITKAKHVYLP
jgi:hypothetical protein